MGAPEIVAAYRKRYRPLRGTDHNASDNAEAVAGAAGVSPVVLPGMEVQTAEDIHIVVIFPGLFEAGISGGALEENAACGKPSGIFGDQLIITRTTALPESRYSTCPGSGISADETAEEVRSRGGLVILAHLDRPSFSYEAVLGPVPDDFPCHALNFPPPFPTANSPDGESDIQTGSSSVLQIPTGLPPSPGQMHRHDARISMLPGINWLSAVRRDAL